MTMIFVGNKKEQNEDFWVEEATYYLSNFSRNLHENETNLAQKGSPCSS